MTTALQNLLDSVGRKITRLKELYEAVCRENQQLKSTLEEKEEEVKRLTLELENSRRDNEFLAMSYRLASNPDDIIKTRRKIAGLIRNIDKCISQLKE
jgi:septal ring factor EnvC (AmiA/AmiB activator)